MRANSETLVDRLLLMIKPFFKKKKVERNIYIIHQQSFIQMWQTLRTICCDTADHTSATSYVEKSHLIPSIRSWKLGLWSTLQHNHLLLLKLIA